jgi:hypothetical protein
MPVKETTMRKFNFMAVAAGLLLLGAPAALLADDSTDNKPADKPGPELREKLQKMTPDERKQWMKDHPEIVKRFQENRGNAQNRGNFEKNRGVLERAGLKPDEIKDLPPAERRAKVKDVMDKRIADLEKKKTDGTALTEQEQSDLDALKQMKGNIERFQQNQGKRQPKAEKPTGDDTK